MMVLCMNNLPYGMNGLNLSWKRRTSVYDAHTCTLNDMAIATQRSNQFRHRFPLADDFETFKTT